MKRTKLNSILFRITEEGYREYHIELNEWAQFFHGRESYLIFIADDSEDFNVEKYKSTYEYMENNQEKILKILQEYCIKEYNYERAVRMKNCRKSNLEDTMKIYSVIEDKKSASKFFHLTKVQILPFEKNAERYVIYDIRVVISEDESMKYRNFEFSILLRRNKFVATIDANYSVAYLEQIITQDKNGQILNCITSTQLDYKCFVLNLYDNLIEKTDLSSIRFRGRSIMGKYKEFLPFASCMELREMEGRNSEYGLPSGSKIIGDIGQDGIFFFIVKRLGIKKEESPIYVVSPMNFDCYIAPVARNLIEFISIGVACRNFGMLESISTSDKVDIEERLTELDDDPNIKELIRIIQKNFSIISIDNPYDYVKQIQSDEILKAESKKLEKNILKKLGLDE